MLDSPQVRRHSASQVADLHRQQTCVFANFVQPGDALLHYECGDAAILSELPGELKAGIEPNTDLASRGIDRGIDVRPTIDSFGGTTFDRIFVSQSPEAMATPVHNLRCLRELLTSTGLLIISQPIIANDQRMSPTECRLKIESLNALLLAAHLTAESASVRRYAYHSKAVTMPSPHFRGKKSYAMVKPFLAFVAVARPSLEPSHEFGDRACS